jgi:hypothetical protein
MYLRVLILKGETMFAVREEIRRLEQQFKTAKKMGKQSWMDEILRKLVRLDCVLAGTF